MVDNRSIDDDDCETKTEVARFNPALYLQRYWKIADLIKEHNINKLVDFGTSEAKVVRYLKKIESLNRITGVDIDENVLEKNAYRIKPEPLDDFFCRENPLTVELFCGDLTQYDLAVADCDAVTLIEVIEHLHDDVLDKLPANIFHRVKPRLVVITTPNSEYNINFPDSTAFRHWDHKFEWTRAQFQTWCQGVAEEYHYDVTYSGVCDPPAGQEVGHCSQIAVFLRQQDSSASQDIESTASTYRLIKRVEFPVKRPVDPDEHLVGEVLYKLHHLIWKPYVDNLPIDAVDEILEVELDTLLQLDNISALCTDKNRLKQLLITEGLKFKGDSDVILYSSNPDDSEDEEEDYPNYDDEYTTNDVTCSAESDKGVDLDTEWDSAIDESWDSPVATDKSSTGQFSDVEDCGDLSSGCQSPSSSQVINLTDSLKNSTLSTSAFSSSNTSPVSESEHIVDSSGDGVYQTQFNSGYVRSIAIGLVKRVISCQNCGYEIVQQREGVYLCGLSDKCRASYTQAFHSNSATRKNEDYLIVVDEQFYDAD